jgi:hypothetical protein
MLFLSSGASQSWNQAVNVRIISQLWIKLRLSFFAIFSRLGPATARNELSILGSMFLQLRYCYWLAVPNFNQYLSAFQSFDTSKVFRYLW